MPPSSSPMSSDGSKAADALAEILRAFEAWDNDEPFNGDGGDGDFKTDADFIIYMAEVAEHAI